jgi:methionyl-tRNA formyltransferase
VEEVAEGSRAGLRIVFWGTPDFALTVLQALFDAGRQVVGVVTQPDRPAGRGRRLQPPPVKLAALERKIPVLQPERPEGDDFLDELRRLAPDVSVVAAYGHILKKEVLDLPRLGSFNVHASLLPELRGAAPVAWAIIRGHEETGVTIMRMAERLDAGTIIRQARCDLPPGITAGELTEKLAELGARTLREALDLIEADRPGDEPQDEGSATYAPKLTPDDVRIDWSRSAVEIERLIRGADPAPAAWTELAGLRVRLFLPRVVTKADGDDAPGVVVRADPRAGLEVATGRGLLEIGQVQPAGKRRMDAAEWIRGRGVETGQRFD